MTMSYLTFDFGGCDVAAAEPVELFLRGKINRDTIYRDLDINIFAYDPYNDTSYLGEKIAYKNIYSDGTPTSSNQYFDYIFDVTDYVLQELEAGNTEITFVLAYDYDQVVDCFNLMKENSWPAGISKDLIFGYVLNTEATRKHNGTTIIYGDGQPAIRYYEYVK